MILNDIFDLLYQNLVDSSILEAITCVANVWAAHCIQCERNVSRVPISFYFLTMPIRPIVRTGRLQRVWSRAAGRNWVTRSPIGSKTTRNAKYVMSSLHNRATMRFTASRLRSSTGKSCREQAVAHEGSRESPDLP